MFTGMIGVWSVRVKPFREIISSAAPAWFRYFFRFGQFNSRFAGLQRSTCRCSRPRNDFLQQVFIIIVVVVVVLGHAFVQACDARTSPHSTSKLHLSRQLVCDQVWSLRLLLLLLLVVMSVMVMKLVSRHLLCRNVDVGQVQTCVRRTIELGCDWPNVATRIVVRKSFLYFWRYQIWTRSRWRIVGFRRVHLSDDFQRFASVVICRKTVDTVRNNCVSSV